MNHIETQCDPKTVLKYSLALLLAVRCRQKDAALQLLAAIYHQMDDKQSRCTMNRLIYLLEPIERDWMRNLA